MVSSAMTSAARTFDRSDSARKDEEKRNMMENNKGRTERPLLPNGLRLMTGSHHNPIVGPNPLPDSIAPFKFMSEAPMIDKRKMRFPRTPLSVRGDGGSGVMIRLLRLVGFSLLPLLGGCFSAHLLETPYKDPLASQREFAEDFDQPHSLQSRWLPISGWWDIQKGHLVQKKPWKSPLPGSLQMIQVPGLASGAYEVETRFSFIKDGERCAGLLLRFEDSDSFYMLRMRRYPTWQDNIDLVQYKDGERLEDLRRMDLTIVPGRWYTLRAEDRGDEIIAFLDGAEVFRYPTPEAARGTVGLAAKGSKIHFERFSAILHTPEANGTELDTPHPPAAAAVRSAPLADAR